MFFLCFSVFFCVFRCSFQASCRRGRSLKEAVRAPLKLTHAALCYFTSDDSPALTRPRCEASGAQRRAHAAILLSAQRRLHVLLPNNKRFSSGSGVRVRITLTNRRSGTVNVIVSAALLWAGPRGSWFSLGAALPARHKLNHPPNL